MNRKSTIQEQAPSGTPLRAKYVHYKTMILVTEISDRDLEKILEIVERNEHPPHYMQ